MQRRIVEKYVVEITLAQPCFIAKRVKSVVHLVQMNKHAQVVVDHMIQDVNIQKMTRYIIEF